MTRCAVERFILQPCPKVLLKILHPLYFPSLRVGVSGGVGCGGGEISILSNVALKRPHFLEAWNALSLLGVPLVMLSGRYSSVVANVGCLDNRCRWRCSPDPDAGNISTNYDRGGWLTKRRAVTNGENNAVTVRHGPADDWVTTEQREGEREREKGSKTERKKILGLLPGYWRTDWFRNFINLFQKRQRKIKKWKVFYIFLHCSLAQPASCRVLLEHRILCATV